MFRNGKRHNSRCITMIVTNTNKPYTRYGLSISSKIGNAVVRNKVKRRIRACIYNLAKEGIEINKKNVVFVARNGIENMSYQELYDNIKKMIVQA